MNHRDREEETIMSQQPQWKRDGQQKKAQKTPKNARRKRQQIKHLRSMLKKKSKNLSA